MLKNRIDELKQIESRIQSDIEHYIRQQKTYTQYANSTDGQEKQTYLSIIDKSVKSEKECKIAKRAVQNVIEIMTELDESK